MWRRISLSWHVSKNNEFLTNSSYFVMIYRDSYKNLLWSDVFSVDGNWGTWQSWNPCNVSCGGGYKLRDRFCNSPAPQNNGKECEPGLFNSTEITRCNDDECPSIGRQSKLSLDLENIYSLNNILIINNEAFPLFRLTF